ncbi:MAG: DUF952 domain-containing protein [Anaerolineae bacterium]|nr:DUF952 domain-containing protein [Anaerolineae bacterium]
MTYIYHITIQEAWEQADRHYTASSLESEGFIHCSTTAQILQVANAFYRDVPNLVLLCIDTEKLSADLKWEAPAHPKGHKAPPTSDDMLFPHVYGTINLDAIVDVVDFPQGEKGFTLPDGL